MGMYKVDEILNYGAQFTDYKKYVQPLLRIYLSNGKTYKSNIS